MMTTQPIRVLGACALTGLFALACQARPAGTSLPLPPTPAPPQPPAAAEIVPAVALAAATGQPSSPAPAETPAATRHAAGTNIALGKTVRASGERGSRASAAIDDNLDTIWNSGDIAPQWIEIQLGAAHVVTGIELVVHQGESAERTVHQVWFWDDRGHYWRVCMFDGETRDRDVLRCKVQAKDVYKVQIVTTTPTQGPKESMTWVAWREIRIWGYRQ